MIPSGTKAFGELDQANDRGFAGIRFHSIQLPDQSEAKIDGRSMSLEFQAMKGTVTGTNAGKRFLVRSLTGAGTIAAATVGVRSGLGVSDTVSNNVLLRERMANNIALAGDQQLTQLAYRQNIVVTVPGSTRFYIVLAKPGGGTFFFDLPTKEERSAIWKIYIAKYGVSGARPEDEGWTGAEIKECCRKAYRLRISLQEPAQYIVPVSRSAAEQIKALRQQASGKFLSASQPGVYQLRDAALMPKAGRAFRNLETAG